MKQHYLRLLVLLLTVPLFTAAHAAQYTYDKLHRLTAVTYDSGDSVYYKYDPAGNLLSVSMAPSYKIGGTLTDAEGNPLSGAVLTLNGQSITTDADGVWLFEGLESGEYTLTVNLEGWLSQTQTITLGEASPTVDIAFNLQPRPPGQPVLFAGANRCANNSAQKASANRVFVWSMAGEAVNGFDTVFTGKGLHLDAVDYDADGSTDIALSERDKGGQVLVYDADGQVLESQLFSACDNKGTQAVFADLGYDGISMLLACESATTLLHAAGGFLETFDIFSKDTAFHLAAGDTDGNGIAEILLSLTKESRSDNVYILDHEATPLRSFIALANKGKSPGLRISAADIDGNGQTELVLASAGKNAGFNIAVYTTNGTLLSQFEAFPANTFDNASTSSAHRLSASNGVPPDLAGCTDYTAQGLLLATGDADGDGRAEIFTAMNGGREVRVYQADGTLIRGFTVTSGDYALSGLAFGEKEAK
jgi:YD repeat-containing protein